MKKKLSFPTSSPQPPHGISLLCGQLVTCQLEHGRWHLHDLVRLVGQVVRVGQVLVIGLTTTGLVGMGRWRWRTHWTAQAATTIICWIGNSKLEFSTFSLRDTNDWPLMLHNSLLNEASMRHFLKITKNVLSIFFRKLFSASANKISKQPTLPILHRRRHHRPQHRRHPPHQAAACQPPDACTARAHRTHLIGLAGGHGTRNSGHKGCRSVAGGCSCRGRWWCLKS